MIRARSTVYAITNQRILIIKRGWFLRTASYAPADVQEIKRFNRDDGCGDVTFRVEWVGSGEDREKREIGFFGVDNAQRVEDLVRGIAQKNGELLAS